VLLYKFVWQSYMEATLQTSGFFSEEFSLRYSAFKEYELEAFDRN